MLGTAVLGSVLIAATVHLAPATSIGGPHGHTCSGTRPVGYMEVTNGPNLQSVPGTTRFSTEHTGPSGVWQDAYDVIGYNSDLNSGYYCENRKNYLPPKLGRQGSPVASFSTTTSGGFTGDTGFDIWLEPSPSDTTYNQMAGQGSSSTEIMIWANNTLGANAIKSQLGGSVAFLPDTVIAGKKWEIAVSLAANGHGKTKDHPKGWNVVDFIAANNSSRATVTNLKLNGFFSYSVSKGWLRGSDYLLATDLGAEMTHGNASVNSYTLSGLTGE